MNKNVKTVLYWLSLICPLADIAKGIIIGAVNGVSQAISEFDEIKQKTKEELIAHKSVLNKKRFDADNEL